MTKTLKRVALLGALVAPWAANPAGAQTPTPEGTVITNEATATWTDANNNSYTPVSASATVTVGFLAGPDVTSPASVSPSSPSTGNELAFTITNTGNGVDSMSVAPTAGTGVTVTGYKLGATTYVTLAELNGALAGTSVSSGSTVTVTVVYTVAPGQGGQTIPVTLTATSRRTPTSSDASTTNVTPGVAAAVNVTPDGATRQRLPSNGTQYTETFTVENTGNAEDTFTLLAAHTGTVLSIVTVNGTAGTGGSITLGAGASTTVDVVYTVADVAAGSTDGLSLTATSDNDGGVSDAGSATIEVIRAALSMTKEAFEDDQTTAITSADRVLPGDYIQYRITVTNNGGAAAVLTGTGFGITDDLPDEVAYVSSSADAAGWTLSHSSGSVIAKLSGTLAAGASRYFWIRVQVQ